MKKNNLLSVSTSKANVDIGVKLHDEACFAEELFITGNVPELGEWDVKKAIRLKKKGDRYETSVEFGKDLLLEFKILNKKDWDGVEKGTWGEEIPNHQVNPSETTNFELDIRKWNC